MSYLPVVPLLVALVQLREQMLEVVPLLSTRGTHNTDELGDVVVIAFMQRANNEEGNM